MSDLRVIDGHAQPPAPERHVTRQELADLMGVSVRSIDTMVSEGMPSERWGMRKRVFRASVAMQWARARDYRREDAA